MQVGEKAQEQQGKREGGVRGGGERDEESEKRRPPPSGVLCSLSFPVLFVIDKSFRRGKTQLSFREEILFERRTKGTKLTGFKKQGGLGGTSPELTSERKRHTSWGLFYNSHVPYARRQLGFPLVFAGSPQPTESTKHFLLTTTAHISTYQPNHNQINILLHTFIFIYYNLSNKHLKIQEPRLKPQRLDARTRQRLPLNPRLLA